MIILQGGGDKNRQKKKKKWIGQNSKDINKEIVGWIQINDTESDYPVLQPRGDSRSSRVSLPRLQDPILMIERCVHEYRKYREHKRAKMLLCTIHVYRMTLGTMFANLCSKYGQNLP